MHRRRKNQRDRSFGRGDGNPLGAHDRVFFKTSLCYTCKRRSGSLPRTCARCKVVPYCSREHQVQDFKAHKVLCKVISNEDKYLEYNVTNYKEMQVYKQQRGLLWQLLLGRSLTKAETQMFMFPRVCVVCFKREKVFGCPECHSEFYCSKEHQEQHNNIHKKFCKDLILSEKINCFLYYNDIDTSTLSVKKIGPELTTLGPGFVNYVLGYDGSISNLNDLLCCDQIFSGLTILFALEQAKILNNRQLLKPSLEIHLVGATIFEFTLQWAWIIEIFFHWINNLEIIHITFIGPEVEGFKARFSALKEHFCMECRARENLLTKESDFYGKFYHKTVDILEKPDVVVAFNSGLHNSDTWKNSLSSLVRHARVPLILTAYTSEEIVQDLKKIEDATKVEIIYGPCKNPFSNLRPLQDWATENVPVYFINNFLAVVIGV